MKRKTVLKKIVANITMGNDSEFRAPPAVHVPAGRRLRDRRRDSVTTVHGCRAVFGDTFAGDQEE